MAFRNCVLLGFVIVAVLCTKVVLGETCYSYECDYYACCGSYCCSYTTFSTGAIIGTIVGSLIFLGLVITCIVACCVMIARSNRRPPTQAVTMHSVAASQNQAGMTTQQIAPPNYYNQAYPPQAPQMQQQVQMPQPQPGQMSQPQPDQAQPGTFNQAYEKDAYPY